MRPKSVGFEGLGNAVGGEISVLPAVCAIADLLTPVAVPGGSAVVGLGCVVVAFAVAADEKEFVGSVGGGIAVKVLQEGVEALPLGQLAGGAGVGRVGLVDETEVGCSLKIVSKGKWPIASTQNSRSQKC